MKGYGYNTQNALSQGLMSLDLHADFDKLERGIRLNAAALMTTGRKGGTNSRFKSEPANALFWKHVDGMPRGAWGSWTFGLPALSVAGGYRPLENAAGVDLDFTTQPGFTRHYGTLLPRGVLAAVLATTAHGDKHNMAVLSGGPLVSDHRGPNRPLMSRMVIDVNASGGLSSRRAGLHSLMEVRRFAELCPGATGTPGPDRFSLALVANDSPDGTGYLHTTYGNVDALQSALASGPITHSTDKHTLTSTPDGPIRAGAIHTNAYFNSGQHSAPLHLTDEPYPAVANGQTPYEVHFALDRQMDHAFMCGTRKGMRRAYVKLPLSETPPCDPTKEQYPDLEGNPDRVYTGPTLVAQRPLELTGIYFQEAI
jgi:hypothetical protein